MKLGCGECLGAWMRSCTLPLMLMLESRSKIRASIFKITFSVRSTC